jgi:hypothetical protein
MDAAVRFPLSSGDSLLTAAQLLFCILPLSSLFVMRTGAPMELHAPRVTAMVSASVAFALLVTMFALSGHALGVYLCSTNLVLRLIEALRYAQLCCRSKRSKKDGLVEPLSAPPPLDRGLTWTVPVASDAR